MWEVFDFQVKSQGMLLFKQLEDQYGYLSISKLHNKIKRGAFISLVMYILYSSLFAIFQEPLTTTSSMSVRIYGLGAGRKSERKNKVL